MTEIATKERPILFSGPMVRAILEGRKSQTRRIMKPQPMTDRVRCFSQKENCYFDGDERQFKCPYGQPGDRLYVRETWRGGDDTLESVFYKANLRESDPIYMHLDKWKPSIHMPRKFSRITLEITEIRVQRLQDISEEDVIAEGTLTQFIPKINGAPFQKHHTIGAFQCLWESINGPGSWDANPWVWAITFRRVRP